MAVPDRTAVLIRRGLTAVVFIIASLSFAFGFGNGWLLGLKLGVPGWIAPLIAPAVDLSVVALLASIQFLRAHGVDGRLAGPRALLASCGLMTFALNTVRPILLGQAGRACFDAIAPLLLIGWSEVGPHLLGLLYRIRGDEAASVLNQTRTVRDRPVVSPELRAQASEAAAAHQTEHGRRITRDALRARLNISNAVAGELLKELRAPVRLPGVVK